MSSLVSISPSLLCPPSAGLQAQFTSVCVCGLVSRPQADEARSLARQFEPNCQFHLTQIHLLGQKLVARLRAPVRGQQGRPRNLGKLLGGKGSIRHAKVYNLIIMIVAVSLSCGLTKASSCSIRVRQAGERAGNRASRAAEQLANEVELFNCIKLANWSLRRRRRRRWRLYKWLARGERQALNSARWQALACHCARLPSKLHLIGGQKKRGSPKFGAKRKFALLEGQPSVNE